MPTSTSAPGLVHRKVRRGTRNFAREAAMTDAELNAALQVGIDLATEAAAQGRTLIALGEMGIGNTSAATAITAALTGQPVAALTGKGTGVDAARRAAKAQIIDQALRLHFGDFATAKPDALEMSALRRRPGDRCHRRRGAGRGTPIASRWSSTASSARRERRSLARIAPNARCGVIAGHLSQEPGHRVLLEHMGVKPLLQLDMRLGEGTGAVLTFPLIEAAVRIYNEMATFGSAGVSEACQRVKTLREFAAAVQFMTRIPMPAFRYEPDLVLGGAKFYPLVGALVALGAIGIERGLRSHLPHERDRVGRARVSGHHHRRLS